MALINKIKVKVLSAEEKIPLMNTDHTWHSILLLVCFLFFDSFIYL